MVSKEIEKLCKNCESCNLTRPNPPKSYTPWSQSQEPFGTIHIDHFAFKGKIFLIIVDQFTKWLDVIEVKSVMSVETIEKLRNCLARFGLPATVVGLRRVNLLNEKEKALYR